MRLSLTLILVFFSALKGSTQVQHVKIGAYVTDVYDFNIAEGTYGVDFWFWTRYKNPSFNFKEHTEVMQSSDVQFEGIFCDTFPGYKFFSAKIKTKVRQHWDLRNYPFDQQTLKLSIESAQDDDSKLRFFLDDDKSKLSEHLPKSLVEWCIKGSRFYTGKKAYQTGYGNPTLEGKSVFSTFNFEIDMERKSSLLIFFKLITGLLVSFVIAVCTFLIKPTHTDPRFGLCVGSLFASIGNKYIVESAVPATNQNTMLDMLHNLTFIFLFIIILTSVVSLRIYEGKWKNSHQISSIIDWTSLLVYVITYFSIASFIVFSRIS